MAIIKAINSKSSISHIIHYVADPEKTEEKLMYGKDCSADPHNAIEDMKMTKEIYGKGKGREYKHFVQSFSPEDKITPEKAHEIGKEWAEKSFKGYEVFIATHTDKDHIHNHFVINSVNFETGEKYQQSNADLQEYKNMSDRICKREGFKVSEKKRDVLTSYNMKEYKAIEKGLNGKYDCYKLDLLKNVNTCRKIATSKEHFISLMNQKGYQVKWSDTRKNITYITLENKKFRDNNLAKTFKNENLLKEELLNEFKRNREQIRGERENRNTADRITGVNERSSSRNKESNIRIGGIFTERDRHIESTSVKSSRCIDEVQRSGSERERDNSSEIQRNGRSIKQINTNNSRGLLETATARIKESTGNNEVKQSRDGIRNKADDRKISSEGRNSIFTKDSNNIFNSRIKSTMPGNIQVDTSLNEELKKQIQKNNEELHRNDSKDKESNNGTVEKDKNKEKYEDKER